MPEQYDKQLLKRAKRIRLVAFDVDGVLTDGSLFLGDDGQEYKAFNSHDGHGIKMLHENGIRTAIITGRTSQVVERRMKNLGVEHVYQGQHNKIQALESLAQALSLTYEDIAFVGDDVVDLPVMIRVGLAIAVANAHELVKQHSHWQTPRTGGRGAARDACEMILTAHEKLDAQWQHYLS